MSWIYCSFVLFPFSQKHGIQMNALAALLCATTMAFFAAPQPSLAIRNLRSTASPDPRVCDQRASIKHGDIIELSGLCINNVTGQIGRRMCANQTTGVSAMFRVFKDPWYASECNALVPGRGLSMFAVTPNGTNTTCIANIRDGSFRCAFKRPAPGNDSASHSNIRMLDKHGMQVTTFSPDGHYVKFRMVNSSVDCNDGTKKPSKQNAFACTDPKSVTKQDLLYGFVIYRASV